MGLAAQYRTAQAIHRASQSRGRNSLHQSRDRNGSITMHNPIVVSAVVVVAVSSSSIGNCNSKNVTIKHERFTLKQQKVLYL